ncbi:hypothetical protein [Undibacterium pigrum]|uniref:Uncharacterized protein n=1 Tax=Undibacterium pigrum TaxID=401470 RepID=A0A318JGF6_9BURK|nr:hypothetical protein [Undibacterium pigrum]PXX46855.1 hypothetical protein DFR42_101431 [Undibacterium pigrum]
MKNSCLLSLLVFFSANVSSAELVYKTYVNGRYGFSIDYPDYLIPQGEAANGDGQVFLSKDGEAELRVYARACIDDWDTTPAEFLKKAETEKVKEGRVISYRAKGKGFAVVSGTKGKQIFYDKLLTTGNWCTFFQWNYAASNKEKYDEATRLIANSFKP